MPVAFYAPDRPLNLAAFTTAMLGRTRCLPSRFYVRLDFRIAAAFLKSHMPRRGATTLGSEHQGAHQFHSVLGNDKNLSWASALGEA